MTYAVKHKSVSELNKSVKERAYQENMCRKFVLRGGNVESMQNEWDKFRD